MQNVEEKHRTQAKAKKFPISEFCPKSSDSIKNRPINTKKVDINIRIGVFCFKNKKAIKALITGDVARIRTVLAIPA